MVEGMRRLIAVAGAVALVVLGAPRAAGAATAPAGIVTVPAASASAVPAEFGSSWDNPRTAAPPVSRPPAASCTTRIVDHAFADYSTYVNAYVPPAACPGPWSKVVLR